MIKLEDLKVGDKIYGVCSNGLGLHEESVVERELSILDTFPNPTKVVLCKGGMEFITRGYEEYLFRTVKEAEEKQFHIRADLAKKLLGSDKFIDRLFECATSPKRLSKYEEYPIYKLAVELHKEKTDTYKRSCDML